MAFDRETIAASSQRLRLALFVKLPPFADRVPLLALIWRTTANLRSDSSKGNDNE